MSLLNWRKEKEVCTAKCCTEALFTRCTSFWSDFLEMERKAYGIWTVVFVGILNGLIVGEQWNCLLASGQKGTFEFTR